MADLPAKAAIHQVEQDEEARDRQERFGANSWLKKKT